MEGRPVPASAADVLPWTPEWTKWPDYERVSSWTCYACVCARTSYLTRHFCSPDDVVEQSNQDTVASLQ